MSADYGYSLCSSNPKVVYLISDTSQTWKSSDGGFNWKMCHNGLHANGGFSIVVDPNNENIVFVASCIGRGLSPGTEKSLSGICRSVNGAESWQMVKKSQIFEKSKGQKHQGKFFAFDKSSFDGKRTKVIYAGSYEEGFYKSTDGGDNWIELEGFKGKQIYDVKMHPKDKGIIYIATNDGLYQYNDKSQNISKIGEGLPDYPRTIAINSAKPEIMYVAVGYHGIYWSTDGGKTFEKRNNGLTFKFDKEEHASAPLSKEYVYVSISSVNPDYLYVSCGQDDLNPFYSHDGGAVWNIPETLDKDGLSPNKDRWFPGQIETHPKDANIALTSANGAAKVLKTEDGGKTWGYSNEGYTGARVTCKNIVFFKDPKKFILFLVDHGHIIQKIQEKHLNGFQYQGEVHIVHLQEQ